MQVQKMDKPNEGVKCVVNSCYYYMPVTDAQQKE